MTVRTATSVFILIRSRLGCNYSQCRRSESDFGGRVGRGVRAKHFRFALISVRDRVFGTCGTCLAPSAALRRSSKNSFASITAADARDMQADDWCRPRSRRSQCADQCLDEGINGGLLLGASQRFRLVSGSTKCATDHTDTSQMQQRRPGMIARKHG